jgi:hypothetical protein
MNECVSGEVRVATTNGRNRRTDVEITPATSAADSKSGSDEHAAKPLNQLGADD